jgi:hypothetical protein
MRTSTAEPNPFCRRRTAALGITVTHVCVTVMASAAARHLCFAIAVYGAARDHVKPITDRV